MGRTRSAPSLLTSSYRDIILPKFVSRLLVLALALVFSLSSFPNLSSASASASASRSVASTLNHRTTQFSSANLITGRPLTSTSSLSSGYYVSPSASSFPDSSSPKIKILQYRVKSFDPDIITEELHCIGAECDELVEPNTKIRLGSGEDETSEWSVPPNVTQIVIECQSKSGLVEWDYEGKGDVSDIEIETNRYAGDFWTKSTYNYISTLRMKHVTDLLTGKYTCRNVEKHFVSNSFHMFVPQENLNIYEEGETVDITPPSYATEIIVPCRLPARKTNIYLMKRRGNGIYRQVPLENGVTFDPYVGFRLPANRDVFGSYACKVDKKRRKQRDISLAMTPPPPPPETTVTLPPVTKFTPIPPGLEAALNISQTPAPSAVRPPGSINNIRLKRRRKRPLLPWRNGPNNLQRNGGGGVGGGGPGGPGNLPLRSRNGGGPMPPRRGVFFHMRRPHPPPMQIIQQLGPLQQSQGQGPQMNTGPGYQPGISYNRLPGPIFNPFLSHSHPGMPKPVKVLPTFSHSGSDGGENQGLVLNSASPFHSEEKPTSSEKKISTGSSEDVMVSRVDTNVGPNGPSTGGSNFSGNRMKPPKRGTVFPPALFPPTVNVVQTMQCMLKKVLLGFDTPCAGMPSLEVDNSKDKATILEANILPPPENKFFPKNKIIYTTVPFFVKWQTRFTDYADWAEVNHTLKDGTYRRHKAGTFEDGVNSLEVFNLNEGDSGEISVSYMGSQKEILTHTWKYFIINNTIYNAKGLNHVKDAHGKSKSQLFKCKSTSTIIPKMTLTPLSDLGCPDNSKNPDFKGIVEAMEDYSVEECGTGCALLRTRAENGLVRCVGDGVDEKIRFPSDLFCTGRPYFVERGKVNNITFEEKTSTLVLPCIINNPIADVYLYKSENDTFKEVTDFTRYDLKSGFHLGVKNLDSPYGTYLCTSTTDLNDDSDMVTFHVNPAPEHVFHPSSKRIYGVPPFKFMWESKEQLELLNGSSGSFYSGVFANPDHNRVNVGTFEISALNVPPGASGEVTVIRSSDKEVVHTWFYKHSKKPGLWLDKEKNVFKCQSTSDFRPKLFAIECSIPNVCKLKKRFVTEDETTGRDNSNCGMGCSQLKIWGNKPTGFVRCKGDGVDESSQYFLAQNSTILTDKDDLENFKTPVITNLVRKLRVGEMTSFSCRASKYFYSKGFQWAVETRNGSKTFVDMKVHEDDSYLNEIKSEINLRIVDANWKAVWCYAPLIESSDWGNVSQPIYIKS